MATVQDVFEITMDLIDERLEDGTLSENDTISYEVKTPGILNILQAELIKQGEMYAVHEIVNNPIGNAIGYKSGFRIDEYTGIEQVYTAEAPARAYYFEVDDTATVYVEDFTTTWNVKETINATSTNGFTAYKGLIKPTDGATRSRLRFAGSYYYRHVNRALFNVPFSDKSKVPDYRPWVKKTMPPNFKSADDIIHESLEVYTSEGDYKWEGKNQLYVDYYYRGNIRIVYRPIPVKLVKMTDNLEIDDVTARTIMPYGLASHLMLSENTDFASFFQQRYEELKQSSLRIHPASIDAILNLYGGV